MDPIQRIRELVARLADEANPLSADEREELRGLINGEFDRLDGEDQTPEVVAQMTELVEGAEALMAEEQRIEAAREEARAQAEELRARMEQVRNPGDQDPQGDEGQGEGQQGEGEGEGEGEQQQPDPANAEVEGEQPEAVEVPAAPVPVAAAAAPVPSHAARMARRSPTPVRPPEAAPPTGRAVVVAAAGLRGLNPGQEITDPIQLAEAMADKLNRLSKKDPGPMQHTIARADWKDAFPEDRRLGADAEKNTRLIEAVCGLRAPRLDRMTRALVATGGVCAPVNVDYTVPVWASTERPLRDGLPSFQATRGGITFVPPPDIGVVSLQGGTASGMAGATGIWSEATDASPGTATKPVVSVVCAGPVTTYVDAIPTRVGFGNMQGRFAPEQIAANTEVALAAAAREAELNLLAKMYAAAKQVNPQKYLGAARDIITTADLLVRQFKYSHRIGDNVGMTAVFPAWAEGLIASDIARELAHDNAGTFNALAVSRDQIEDWLEARGITNVIWTLEGLQGGTYGTGGQALLNQYFTLATAGAEPQWPNQSSDGTVQVGWLLFVEGTFQHLDGGELDLGVVRDATLDATNDYETFAEIFEGVAFRGLEAYQVQSVVQPTGASAAGVTATYHE